MHDFPNRQLLLWYESVKRDLPWRRTSDPYHIWVSEIILQQTRVDQGLPYYDRFTARFPSVMDLANATEDEVLKLWEGLGYYSRARNMHTAARFISDKLKGKFPTEYKGLLALKGVGPYTAAAIGSIAFNLPNAAVDGNVIRVIARYSGIGNSVDETSTKKQVAALAQDILTAEQPADHNQAMMELGATTCTPTTPKCADCPLKGSCAAFAQDLQTTIPVKTKKTKVRDRFFYYAVCTDGVSTVLHRRAKGDIWEGLYEFPLFESEKELEETAIFELMRISEKDRILSVSEKFKHILSHQRIFARFVSIGVKKLRETESTHVKLTDLNNFAMPRLINRYLEKQSLGIAEEV